MHLSHVTTRLRNKASTKTARNITNLFIIIVALQTIQPAKTFAAQSGRGNGLFELVVLSELNWRADDKNNAIVENIKFTDQLLSAPICLTYYNDLKRKNPTLEKFESCTLSKNFNNEELQPRTYTNINALSKSELDQYIGAIGNQGHVGPLQNNAQAYFQLILQTKNTTSYSYLPAEAPTGGGVPPIEVEPPISCTLAAGNLDYGNITEAQVDNNVVEKSFGIYCTGPANVRISAPAYNAAKGITMNGASALSSFIKIDNVSAEKGVAKYVNHNANISISSKLSVSKGKISPGSYNGSIIIAVDLI